jgi:hypothetical protein
MRTIHTAFLLVAAIAAAAPAAGTAEASVAAPAHGRAWELVTPPEPNGAPVDVVYGIAPDGDRLVYTTVGAVPGAQAGSLRTPSLGERTPSGWTRVPIGPPYSIPRLYLFPPVELAGASEDMTRWIWSSSIPLTSDGPSSFERILYSSTGAEGVATFLDAVASGFEFSGGSADMRRVVFQSGGALLPEDVRSGGRQVYERSDAGLRLVGVDSAGVPLSPCGAIVGSDSYPPSPISRDGRRIFVTSPDTGCGTRTKRVYLREDGATTTEVSASQCARVSPACNAPADVRFMGATPSGSVVFLATAQQLTDDDRDASQDLYRYDVASGVLSRVSAGPAGIAAAVTATAAYPSDDGSRVYFVAGGLLVPGKGVVGGSNVYLSDGGGLRFVATLTPFDSWRKAATISAGREDVQLTPDGKRLAFMSTAALTADDTDTRRDVFLYDADDHRLERVSGRPGTGNGDFDAGIAQGTNAIQPTAGQQLRSLSVDGRHLFFTTDEALTPDDSNTTVDVYEWEEGDVGLVSAGGESTFLRYHTASADGRSVFFTTSLSLTPDDDDGGYVDLYVARKDGGFPAPEPSPPACAGDECGASPVTRLVRSLPATVGFVAARERLDVLPVSAAARRRAAARGHLTLGVSTGTPGRLTARARARIGRRTRTVASGAARAARAGIVRLRLQLSPAARRHLRAGRALTVDIAVRRSAPERSTASLSLKLAPPR